MIMVMVMIMMMMMFTMMNNETFVYFRVFFVKWSILTLCDF